MGARSRVFVVTALTVLALLAPTSKSAVAGPVVVTADDAVMGSFAVRADIHCPSGGLPLHAWVLIPDDSAGELGELADDLAARGHTVFVLELRSVDEPEHAAKLVAMLDAIRRLDWKTADGACAAPARGSAMVIDGVLTNGRGANVLGSAIRAVGCDVALPGATTKSHLVVVAPTVAGDLRDAFASCPRLGRLELVVIGAESCNLGVDAALAALEPHAPVDVVRIADAEPCDVLSPGYGSGMCEARCGPRGDHARERVRRCLAMLALDDAAQACSQYLLEAVYVPDAPAVEPDPEPGSPDPWFNFNLSAVLGGGWTRAGDRSKGGVAWGFRPEIVFGGTSSSALRIGPYLEVASMGGTGILFGGGGTVTVPLRGTVTLAPSIGVFTASVFDDDYDAGWTAGAFLGKKLNNDISYFDGSLGIRADFRRTFDDGRTSLTVAVQIDLMVLVALFAWL